MEVFGQKMFMFHVFHPNTSFLSFHLMVPLTSYVFELRQRCLPPYSCIVCASPQRVTPASAELRVVVCSQKAWEWRRLQTSRFTPKELALESLKSPSRDPVSYIQTSGFFYRFVQSAGWQWWFQLITVGMVWYVALNNTWQDKLYLCKRKAEAVAECCDTSRHWRFQIFYLILFF